MYSFLYGNSQPPQEIKYCVEIPIISRYDWDVGGNRWLNKFISIIKLLVYIKK